MDHRLFGTDGIRGTPGVYPLTDAVISKLGKACANLLYCQNGTTNHYLKIVIGKDTRLSCETIEKILASNISSCGVEVILAGTIPTPGLAFLTRKLKADMGIMISASHNQAKDNGIKIFSNSGYKLTLAQEEKIEKLVFNGLMELDALPFNSPGLVSQLKDGQRIYIDFLKSHFSDLGLKGLKIVLDCAYGATSNIAPLLFKELGAEVYSVNDQPNGANINLNCGALYPQNSAKLVTKYHADIGFSYDGDADRVILADEKGNLADGDFIMAIISLHLMQKNMLPENTLVITTMSNYGLREAMENAGIRLIQTDVGDRIVTETLLKNKLLLGGEQSGHIIFLNRSTTGDALITSLEILKVMKEANKKLSELSQCMRKFPQVLVNVRVKEKKPFEHIPQVQERISYSESRLNGMGRLLVRYSGTEPLARIMVEGKDQNLIEEIADSLAEQIKKEIGSEN
jgi:phosphoglucosamine mutase